MLPIPAQPSSGHNLRHQRFFYSFVVCAFVITVHLVERALGHLLAGSVRIGSDRNSRGGSKTTGGVHAHFPISLVKQMLTKRFGPGQRLLHNIAFGTFNDLKIVLDDGTVVDVEDFATDPAVLNGFGS